MILSLAIIINLTFAIALIAGLAYAMSRTIKLTPHLAASELAAQPVQPAAWRAQGRPARRRSAVLASARA